VTINGSGDRLGNAATGAGRGRAVREGMTYTWDHFGIVNWSAIHDCQKSAPRYRLHLLRRLFSRIARPLPITISGTKYLAPTKQSYDLKSFYQGAERKLVRAGRFNTIANNRSEP
jgi:hypothetical protein